jgi:hypothetical protein
MASRNAATYRAGHEAFDQVSLLAQLGLMPQPSTA